MADTFIDKDKPDDNNGSVKEIFVRAKDDGNLRGLLWFDLSDIPSNAVITSANLYLYETSQSNTQVISIYPLKRAWTETEVTWNTPWLTPGGDFTAAPAYAAYIPDQIGCSITIDLTGLVQGWTSGAIPNYGMIFYSTGDFKKINYASKEADDADQWPRLLVEYEIPPLGQSGSQGIARNWLDWLRDLFG